MKVFKKLCLFLGSLLCVGCSTGAKTEGGFVYKDMMDALSKAEGMEYVLLDVRTDEEFKEGYIPGAKHLPLSEIQAGNFGDLDKDGFILVYCRSGNRSGQAVKILQENGFTNVHNIGGIMDYKGELSK